MKSILLSIRPEWVEKILNGEKTIEIRKKFPKDYVGWVYIYCTKEKPYLVNDLGNYVLSYNHKQWVNSIVNGKVVARFWCDNVEDLMKYANAIKDQHFYDSLKCACLNTKQLQDYLGNNTKSAYAIHISKLEVFDKPRELGSFGKYCLINEYLKGVLLPQTIGAEGTKAPQNYCFVVDYSRQN